MNSIWLLIPTVLLLAAAVWQLSATKPEPRRRSLRLLAVVGVSVTILFVLLVTVSNFF